MGTHITYDTVVPGQPLRTVTHHLTPEMVADYRAATGEADPAAEPDAAPPAMAGILGMAVLGYPGVDRPNGDVHVEQEFRFVAPLPIDEPLTTSGHVLEKYVRNGRKYLVFDARTLDATGRLLVIGRATVAVPE